MASPKKKRITFWSSLLLTTVANCLPYGACAADIGPGTDWHFLNALPQGNDLHGCYAPTENELFAGGVGGIIVHWVQGHWGIQQTPTNIPIHALHGTATNDVWAVGGDGYSVDNSRRSLLMHWDGAAWTKKTAPRDRFDQESVYQSVFALSPNDVWAVGTQPAAVARWNGTAWSLIDIPLSWEGNFLGLHAFGPDDIFVSGTHGQIMRRYNGSWTMEQKTESGNFSTNILDEFSGLGPDSLYAGGTWGQVYRRNADGTWTDMQFDTSWSQDNTIRRLYMRNRGQVFILGNNSVRFWTETGTPVRQDFSMVMRRQWFDGAAAGNMTYGVGPGGVVGELRLGAQTVDSLSTLGAGGCDLPSIYVNGSVPCGDGLLVYGRYWNATPTMPMYYFDGTTPTSFPTKPQGMEQNGDITAVWASGIDDIIIAWSDYQAGGGVHRWDGQTWTRVGEFGPVPSRAFELVKRPPMGQLYACDSFGITRLDGSDWTQIFDIEDTVEDDWFTCFTASNSTEMYLGTSSGAIYRHDGTAFRAEVTPKATSLKSILIDGPDVYASGEDGHLWVRKNGTWNQVHSVPLREEENFGAMIRTPTGIHVSQSTNSSITDGGFSRIWRLSNGDATLHVSGISGELNIFGANDSGVIIARSSNGASISNGQAPQDHWQRVDRAATGWTTLGPDGVQIRFADPAAGSPAVVYRRNRPVPPPFLNVPSTIHYWTCTTILQDHFPSGAALGAAYLRLPCNDPAAVLYQNNGSGWEVVECTFLPGANMLETNQPAQWHSFALGTSNPVPTPTPTPTPTPHPGEDVVGQILGGTADAADANGDGIIDAADVVELLQ